jgi:hypothetical protein
MNVRLGKAWHFSCIVVGDRYETPLVNFYTVKTEMTLASEQQDYNTAYGRMKFWINEVMADCVLIAKDNEKLKTWIDTNARVLTLPDEPVDQLIGMLLYSKLSAISEDRIILHQVSISSALDDDIIYHHFEDEPLGPFREPGWWNDSQPVWKHKETKGRGKVISLDRQLDWNDYDLDWDQEPPDTVVVKGNFSRDEDK